MALWSQLDLDAFWTPRLPESRKGTEWLNVLKTLVSYRLLDPDSEWRLHRDWFKTSAMADLLGEDDSVAAKNTLYRCLDKLCEHKTDLFSSSHFDLFCTAFTTQGPLTQKSPRPQSHPPPTDKMSHPPGEST